MSKEFEPISLSLAQCERELVEFGTLLESRISLSESIDFAPFFWDRPQLAALAGSYQLPHNIDGP